ncbi:aromatic prenyltransferase [Aspergillus undulatus]|uniref:aromatic prenyltransferase n=1 Tax=Aspergillus undulatus TaxID=1810928 RepID=UPI003CCD4F8D
MVGERRGYETEKEWWLDSGSLLARMLDVSEYTTDQQYHHLLFFHRHLIPFLGPKPIRWPSLISGSGLPIEYSLNFQENSTPVIRAATEPVGYEAGTPADPFNKRPLEKFVTGAFKYGVKGFDTALLDHFAQTLFLPDADVFNAVDLNAAFPRTHAGIGFDFKGDNVVIKGYVHPGWRSRASGIPVSTLVKDSVDGIQRKLNCKEAFSLVNEYMDESDSYNLRTFIAWDCTPIHTSRLKIYGIHNDVSLAKIEELWTMGGRLTDVTAHEGLNHLRRLWGLLDINNKTAQSAHYDEGGDTQNQDGQPGCESNSKSSTPDPKVERRLPLFWNYEMKSGSTRVAPKIYFPVYGENDLMVATALSRFFASLGWDKKANEYVGLVRQLYPDLDVSKTSRLQALISFAYSQEKGVYMSVYYHSTSCY